MPYRRTENVNRRLAARRDAIIAAARMLASESGMAAVQIAAVAARAGIATGTVYRYFPAKTDLIAALLTEIPSTRSERCSARRRRARSAVGACRSDHDVCGARFAIAGLFAAIAEPIDAEVDAVRTAFRKALAAEFAARITATMAARHLPDQDVALAAAALTGFPLKA